MRGLFDDFLGFGFSGAISTADAWANSNGIAYHVYLDDNAGLNAAPGIMAAVPTTTPAVDLNGPGVLSIDPDDDGDDDAIIQAGNGTMMPFAVIPGTSKDLAFECRFKISAIAASETDFFIGLGGTGACANDRSPLRHDRHAVVEQLHRVRTMGRRNHFAVRFPASQRNAGGVRDVCIR